MKVLVTGNSGMVGRNLVKALSRRGDLNLLTPQRNDLDLLDRRAVEKYLCREKPDFVFHLAAKVGGIQANINDPVGFLTENMLIGMHVIWGALQAGVARLINLGTSCMYPKDCELLRESDLLTGPLEPTNEGYALANISAAFLCKYIYETENRAYKTVIPCNLYGPHDHFDPTRSHLVAAVLLKLHEAKLAGLDEVGIWGDGEARREFMHVSDLVRFLELSLEQIEALPVMINVGAGYDYTINEYYHAAARVVGFSGGFIHDVSKPVGMRRKLLDVTLAAQFGWKAQCSLPEGLADTYRFFLSQQENRDHEVKEVTNDAR